MKLIRTAIAGLLIFGMASLTTGCFGSFQLTRNFYQWHDSTIENKFLKSLLFYIPFGFVYMVTTTIDFLILNLIEFWGGSNPVAMEEGDYEMEYHQYGGVNYKMEATQNMFKITQLDGDEKGKITVIRFDEQTKSRFYEEENSSIALMTFTGENADDLMVYAPNGETVMLNLDQEYSTEEITSIYKRTLDHSTLVSR